MLTFSSDIYKEIMSKIGLCYKVSGQATHGLDVYKPTNQKAVWEFIYPETITNLMMIRQNDVLSSINTGNFTRVPEGAKNDLKSNLAMGTSLLDEMYQHLCGICDHCAIIQVGLEMSLGIRTAVNEAKLQNVKNKYPEEVEKAKIQKGEKLKEKLTSESIINKVRKDKRFDEDFCTKIEEKIEKDPVRVLAIFCIFALFEEEVGPADKLFLENLKKQCVEERTSVRASKKEIVDRRHPFLDNSNTCKFFGRSEELQELKEFAYSDSSTIRWWSIIGPGGSGKSRLAKEFMNTLCEDEWDTFVLTREMGLSFDNLMNTVKIKSKNVFVLVDVETAEMEPLARWMSYQYTRRNAVDICVLLCRRTSRKLINGELESWYSCMIEYNELVPSFEYFNARNEELILRPLDKESLSEMVVSYICTVYPSFSLEEEDVDKALKKLKEIDPYNFRALYLLFIADAIANGDVSKINNEDGVLNYAFMRERSFIRDKIQSAFGCDYLHNKKLYDAIERSIAENACNIFSDRRIILSGHEEAGLNKEEYLSLTDAFGLSVNGNVRFLEPDLLAEYFYIRYADSFAGAIADQKFWVALFRDFNYLLTTKYRNILKQFFPYANAFLGLYYIEGIYEAFCLTDSKGERERLAELLNHFESDFEEWVGEDPMLHPFGPELAINMFYMTQGERLLKVRTIMSNTENKDCSFLMPTQHYDVYDSFIGNYASRLCKEIEAMLLEEENALPLIDKVNEFTKLFEESVNRDSEVPYYYAYALYYTILFFFARGLEYEEKLASQVAKMVPAQLKRLSDMEVPDATRSYLLVLMMLYTNDNYEYYKKREDLLCDIYALYEVHSNNSEFVEIFTSFFDYISTPRR